MSEGLSFKSINYVHSVFNLVSSAAVLLLSVPLTVPRLDFLTPNDAELPCLGKHRLIFIGFLLFCLISRSSRVFIFQGNEPQNELCVFRSFETFSTRMFQIKLKPQFPDNDVADQFILSSA